VYYEFIEKGQEEQDEVFVMSKEEEEAVHAQFFCKPK